jgi:hypothetical protein
MKTINITLPHAADAAQVRLALDDARRVFADAKRELERAEENLHCVLETLVLQYPEGIPAEGVKMIRQAQTRRRGALDQCCQAAYVLQDANHAADALRGVRLVR